MTKANFLLLLDNMLECDPHTVKDTDELNAIGWDSLAVLNFIAILDQKLGVTVEPADIAKCRTVNDLVALAGAAVTN